VCLSSRTALQVEILALRKTFLPERSFRQAQAVRNHREPFDRVQNFLLQESPGWQIIVG